MGLFDNKIVLVTGATAGIGRSTARAFAREGANVIVTGRRAARLVELADELRRDFRASAHHFPLDVQDAKAVHKAVANLPREWEAIDILVNNAGLSRGLDKIHEGTLGDWEEMIDTNIKGLLYVSRAVIPGMVRRGSGHIVNIGSIAGLEVYPGGNVYCATKAAVGILSKAMRIDLMGTSLRVTNIDPGMVETEFSVVRFHGDQERAAKVYQGLKPLSPDDVAEAIIFCASRPPHVNVSEVIIMATAQATAMLAHRK